MRFGGQKMRRRERRLHLIGKPKQISLTCVHSTAPVFWSKALSCRSNDFI
jgi:hypothetical protein